MFFLLFLVIFRMKNRTKSKDSYSSETFAQEMGIDPEKALKWNPILMQ